MMNVMRRMKRRGVAMLLVLISLGMATIIATSYLSSRDNSSVIGASVFDAAVARWTADSGVELTVAILETQSDWRTAHTEGVLLDGFPLSGGLLRIELLDLETLQPPNADTRAVEITAIGASNGHQQMATAEAYILNDGTNLINVDLSEFAAFATSNVIMNDNALITMWPESPGRHLSERVALGTNETALGTISLNGNAAVIDGTVFAGPGASASLILNANSPEVETIMLNDQIPVLAPAPSGVTSPEDDSTVYSTYSPSGLAMLLSNKRWATITPQSGTLINAMGDLQIVSEDDLVLASNTAFTIEGNLELVLFDDLIMHPGSYIELKPGSTLTIYVGDDIQIDDAYIGDERDTAERAAPDTTGQEGYFDPKIVQIYGMSGGDSWSLQHQALVQGTLYGPSAQLNMQHDAAVYGRIAVETLEMSDNAALFYDPVLNNGTGYTNPYADVFIDADEGGGGGGLLGWLVDAVVNVLDFSSDSLNDLANEEGVAIEHDGQIYGTLDADVASVGPGDPTPRNVVVAYHVSSFGSYVGNWEAPSGSSGTGSTFTETQPKKTREVMDAQ